MKRKVIVVPYQQEWPFLFQKEAQHLSNIFQPILVDIHHIGSTSVPNLASKPIIDILVVVKEIRKVDLFEDLMKHSGYIAKGENGITGRRFFYKGERVRTHHVHVFEEGNSHILRHLAFCEYLRTHREDRQRYEHLKKKLANQFPEDIEGYMTGKAPLIKEIEQKAMKWYLNRI
ncbi:GrpB family protein [Thermoflavimicrobium dichotomicum]|nr:GrpB family protein [Thermoflavimicrobium dichotomicum]